MPGTLYIVPTPIGNLEDITLRALKVLKHVSLIAAEDTRTSRVLLDHYEISTPMTSYHEHNKLSKLEVIFDALAQGDVALISDAGTPGVSDPGYELIREALRQEVRVVPLPGASAVISALVGSGLPTDSFIYLGFLPRKKLTEFFTQLKEERRTMIAYENPYRLIDALVAIKATLGAEREVCVAREISKMFEEFTRGPVSEMIARYREEPARGEITLVIGGSLKPLSGWDAEQVRAALQARLAAGEKMSQAAKDVARESGWKKNAVYALGVDARGEES